MTFEILFFITMGLAVIAFVIGWLYGKKEGYLKGKIEGIAQSNERFSGVLIQKPIPYGRF